jgi:hypothetical protein
MKTQMLAKDASSGKNGCPAVHLAETGQAVVQGPKADADTMANLPNLLPGETAVLIDADVIERAAAQLLARRRQV